MKTTYYFLKVYETGEIAVSRSYPNTTVRDIAAGNCWRRLSGPLDCTIAGLNIENGKPIVFSYSQAELDELSSR